MEGVSSVSAEGGGTTVAGKTTGAGVTPTGFTPGGSQTETGLAAGVTLSTAGIASHNYTNGTTLVGFSIASITSCILNFILMGIIHYDRTRYTSRSRGLARPSRPSSTAICPEPSSRVSLSPVRLYWPSRCTVPAPKLERYMKLCQLVHA